MSASATTLTQLLPEGIAWPRDSQGLTRDAVIGALARGYDRVRTRAQQLIEEADPRTAVEMLGEWEANLSLPDSCTGLCSAEAETIADRQRRAHSKLISIGGNTFGYFKGVAAALGYEIEIEEHVAATCDSDCESPLDPDDAIADGLSWPWCFVVDIRASATTVFELDCASGGCDEPLSWWGESYFECVMRREFRRRLATRHLAVRFLYGAANA